MKQLSLLLLAGLTTSCFAVEQEKSKSCLDLVKMLRNPQYRTIFESSKDAGVDALTIPGMEDCAEKYDELAQLSSRRDIDPADLEILFAIRGRLAERRGIPHITPPSYLSLETAIARGWKTNIPYTWPQKKSSYNAPKETAEYEQPTSCWELAKMLRNPQYRATTESEDALKIPGMQHCMNNYDLLADFSDRRDIEPTDLEILFAIRGRLAERRGLPRLASPTYLSLEEAIADEQAMQAFLRQTHYVETTKKAPGTPKANILDSSSRVDQDIVKTREFKSRA